MNGWFQSVELPIIQPSRVLTHAPCHWAYDIVERSWDDLLYILFVIFYAFTIEERCVWLYQYLLFSLLLLKVNVCLFTLRLYAKLWTSSQMYFCHLIFISIAVLS